MTHPHTTAHFLAAAALAAALALGGTPVQARDLTCAAAEQRLASTGLGDPDDDGLTSCRERRDTRTNPRRADTDRDGLDDGAEVAAGTAPRDRDSDDDGLDDGAERDVGTDPMDADTDDDGLDDGDDDNPTGDADADLDHDDDD